VNELGLAALLAVTILLASMVSIEIGLSVALIELAAGDAVGNLFTVTVCWSRPGRGSSSTDNPSHPTCGASTTHRAAAASPRTHSCLQGWTLVVERAHG
jgi:hypothetical protein